MIRRHSKLDKWNSNVVYYFFAVWNIKLLFLSYSKKKEAEIYPDPTYQISKFTEYIFLRSVEFEILIRIKDNASVTGHYRFLVVL